MKAIIILKKLFFGSVLKNYAEHKKYAVKRALKIDHTQSKSKSEKE